MKTYEYIYKNIPQITITNDQELIDLMDIEMMNETKNVNGKDLPIIDDVFNKDDKGKWKKEKPKY